MDDSALERLQHVQQGLLEQFVKLVGLVTELRASVSVLKLYVATQIAPDNPVPVLKALELMEKELLRTSPDEQERLRTVEMIQAIKDLKKHGSPGSA